jgi:hypothetical protein
MPLLRRSWLFCVVWDRYCLLKLANFNHADQSLRASVCAAEKGHSMDGLHAKPYVSRRIGQRPIPGAFRTRHTATSCDSMHSGGVPDNQHISVNRKS